MKAKKMSAKKEEECCGMKYESCCESSVMHRPRGKALFEIGLGIILVSYYLKLVPNFELVFGLAGALMLLKGAVRFFDSSNCC